MKHLHPREFPSAEALQQRQQSSFAEFLISETDLLAIGRKELAIHSYTCHFGECRGGGWAADGAFKRLGAAAAAGGTKRRLWRRRRRRRRRKKKEKV